MYNEFVPQLTHALTSLSNILAKAEAHCDAKKIKHERMLSIGLTTDMFTLTKQVQTVTDFCFRAPTRLVGKEPENNPDTETNFEELRARISKAITHLQSFKAEDFANSATVEVTMKTPNGDRKMTGFDYLYSFVYPNFYFHMTCAYAILRANGVDLGKGDFLGRS